MWGETTRLGRNYFQVNSFKPFGIPSNMGVTCVEGLTMFQYLFLMQNLKLWVDPNPETLSSFFHVWD